MKEKIRRDAHKDIDHIFKELLPAQGLPERPEQTALSHRMLDVMLNGGIALCDAGTGIGKTYTYLTAGIIFQRIHFMEGKLLKPLLISTSSIALQKAVRDEYLPFLSAVLMVDGMIMEPIQAVIRKGKAHYVCADIPFSDFGWLLIAPDRVLDIIQKQIANHLSVSTRRQLEKLSSTVKLFCEGNANMLFYTAEDEDGGTVLCAAVSDLTAQLQNTLWNGIQSVVLASGTLAAGGSFQHYKEAVGLVKDSRVTESISLLPFDYRRNCLLYFPQFPPRQKDDIYYDQLTTEIALLLKAASGHALVLFTSYAAMSSVKERLKEKDLPWPVFTLGRNALHTTEQFKASPGSILLAAGAAWEGFDFPGDCISLLVIPRLPFAQPDALTEKLKESYFDLHSFIRAVVVPEMQIKLRQGFGRAVRTETDTCVIAILDERSSPGQRYFKDVKTTLPNMRITDSIQEVEAFIRSVKEPDYFQKIGKN